MKYITLLADDIVEHEIEHESNSITKLTPGQLRSYGRGAGHEKMKKRNNDITAIKEKEKEELEKAIDNKEKKKIKKQTKTAIEKIEQEYKDEAVKYFNEYKNELVKIDTARKDRQKSREEQRKKEQEEDNENSTFGKGSGGTSEKTRYFKEYADFHKMSISDFRKSVKEMSGQSKEMVDHFINRVTPKPILPSNDDDDESTSSKLFGSIKRGAKNFATSFANKLSLFKEFRKNKPCKHFNGNLALAEDSLGKRQKQNKKDKKNLLNDIIKAGGDNLAKELDDYSDGAVFSDGTIDHKELEKFLNDKKAGGSAKASLAKSGHLDKLKKINKESKELEATKEIIEEHKENMSKLEETTAIFGKIGKTFTKKGRKEFASQVSKNIAESMKKGLLLGGAAALFTGISFGGIASAAAIGTLASFIEG